MKARTLSTLLAAFAAACSGGGGGGNQTPGNPGTIQLEQASYATLEGTGATVTIAAVRTGGSDGAVSVQFATASGTATQGADFQGASGTLAWSAGEQGAKTFGVTISNDAMVEGSETFGVSLQAPTGGAALGTPSSAVVTISDHDQPGPGTIRFSASSPTVDEGAGTRTITVLRTDGNEGAVSVSFASGGGTATAGADYTAVSGTLTWADGDATARTFDVPILDDDLPEPYESVALTLSSPTGGASVPSPVATLVIRNDDAHLSLRATATGTGERGERVVISVERSGATPTAVTVRCETGGGTATAGVDYVPSAITFSWPAGTVSSQTFDVTPLDDSVREGDESVVVTLSAPTGGATLVDPSSVVVTIADDEPPAEGHLAFAADQYVTGNSSGTATISVARTGPTAVGAVSVSYATVPGGNATEGIDYLATSGTLSWADGEAGVKTFTVPIVDDLVADPADWVALELSAATGGAELGPQRTAQLVIREHWTKSPYQPVLGVAAGGAELDVRAPSVVRLGPAEYVMYFEANGTTAADPVSKPRIRRAVSSDGITWTRSPADPVLDAGAAGAFDQAGVASPSVLFDGSTWHMWYGTGSEGDLAGGRIGYATSADGIAWARQSSGNAVLDPGAGVAWDRRGVAMPAVVQEGGGFTMWYVGVDLWPGIGRATSPDGVTWTRDAANPVLLKGAGGSWSSFGVFEPVVVKDGATYRMWVEGFSGSNQWIGYAVSPDGTAWTEYPSNPVLTKGSGSYWDDAGVGAPAVVKAGETFEMWYRGAGNDGPSAAIGRATLP